MKHCPSLLELSLTEQLARNEAALAAIRSRSLDILELNLLADALAARGVHVRPAVNTYPVGSQAECRLHLWLSCTEHELALALEWLAGADISITRISLPDVGSLRAYQLGLRGQTIQLNASVHDALTASRFDRVHQSAVA